MATAANFRDIMRGHCVDMVTVLDVTPGIVREMSRRGQLTPLQEKTFLEEPIRSRTPKFLDYLKRGDFARFTAFCEALKAVGKNTLAERWSRPAVEVEISPALDPLKLTGLLDNQKNALRMYWTELVVQINVDPVIDKLKDDFTPYAFKTLKAEPPEKRTRSFLEHLRRSSQSFYVATMAALIETNQSDIVKKYFPPPIASSGTASLTKMIYNYVLNSAIQDHTASIRSGNGQPERPTSATPVRDVGKLEVAAVTTAEQSTASMCSVCLDAKPNAVFIECGHIACCEACVIALTSGECPVCRTKSRWIKCFEV